MSALKFDLFISHASEDKDELVRPLAAALAAAGLHVWYDEFSLRVGDNLRQSIDKGLATSRFGVIVLSKWFFRKQWPQWELDGLLQRQLEGKKVILPIWHRVKAADVKRYSLSLANVKGVATKGGLGTVIDQILDVVLPDGAASRRRLPKKSGSPATINVSIAPVSRVAMPIRRLEPHYLEYAAALQAGLDAPAQDVLRRHPEMYSHISGARGSFVRTNFELGQHASFDAVYLRGMSSVFEATLVTLAPVSEPPFDASGAWSTSLCAAVGRIAAAKRWIARNGDAFHSSLLGGLDAVTGPDRYIDRLRRILSGGGSAMIRPQFLIVAGRRATIDADKRQRFHESFQEATILSYDSILYSLSREEFRVNLAKPIVVTEVALKPGGEIKVSVTDWPLSEALSRMEHSLPSLPADAKREISGIEVALAGEYELPATENRYACEPGEANKMSICIKEGADSWTHAAVWAEWIYSKARSRPEHAFGKVFRITCKAPSLRTPKTLQLVIRSVEYKEHRRELKGWEASDGKS